MLCELFSVKNLNHLSEVRYLQISTCNIFWPPRALKYCISTSRNIYERISVASYGTYLGEIMLQQRILSFTLSSEKTSARAALNAS